MSDIASTAEIGQSRVVDVAKPSNVGRWTPDQLPTAFSVDQKVYIKPYADNKQGDAFIARSAGTVAIAVAEALTSGENDLAQIPLERIFTHNEHLTTTATKIGSPGYMEFSRNVLPLNELVFVQNTGRDFDTYRDTSEYGFQYHTRMQHILQAYGVSFDESTYTGINKPPNHWIAHTAPLLLPSPDAATAGLDLMHVIQQGEALRFNTQNQYKEVMYIIEAGSEGKRFSPEQVALLFKGLKKEGRIIKIMTDRGPHLRQDEPYQVLIAAGLMQPEDLIHAPSAQERAIHYYASDRVVLTDTFDKWLAASAITMRPDRPIMNLNGNIIAKSQNPFAKETLADLAGSLQPGDLDVFYSAVSPQAWALFNENAHYFQSMHDRDRTGRYADISDAQVASFLKELQAA